MENTQDTRFNHLLIAEDSEEELAEINETMPYEILKAAKTVPVELHQKTADELETMADLGFTDWKVKKSFWQCYKASVKTGRRASVNRIISGISNRVTFRKRFLNDPSRLAWLLSPASGYSVQVNALLDMSTKRYEELINMPITSTKKLKYKDADGNDVEKIVTEIDAKKAMVLLSVIKNLEERALGGAVQRQLSVKTTEPSSADGEQNEVNMDAVNDRLKELEMKLGGEPVTIEV